MAKAANITTLLSPAPTVETGDQLDHLVERLREHRDRVDVNPHANPIKLLAYDILRDLIAGRLDDRSVDAILRRLTGRAFAKRAERIRAYLGEMDPDANRRRVMSLVEDALGEKGDFKDFKDLVERVHFGFVITAHPTFSLSLDLSRDLVTLATGRKDGEPLEPAEEAAILGRVEARTHRPETDLSLDVEHAWSMEAIANLRLALHELYGWLFDLAVARFGEAAALRVVPRLVSIASWVGYDTDGRSDIGWTVTLAKRMTVQVSQLRYYRDAVRHIRSMGDGGGLNATLELIEAKLSLAIHNLEEECKGFAALKSGEASFETSLAALARSVVGKGEERLADAAVLRALVERALGAAGILENQARSSSSCAARSRHRGSVPPARTFVSTRSNSTTRSARRSAWSTSLTTRATA